MFYLHYTSIIYHLAQVVKYLEIKTPRYLCFSGNGSKYLRLLAGGSSLVAIEKITKAIFQAVTGTEPPHNFRVILADNPKEATTNGGVLYEEKANNDFESIQAIKLSGTVEGGELNKQRLKLNQVDAALKDDVLTNVRNYLTLVLEGDEVAPYLREVGVDVDRHRVKDILLREIEDSLSLGLHQFQRQLSADETMPETLFFLPLKQALYNLSRELQA